MPACLKSIDRAVVIAFSFILVMLVAAFLGIIASGVMMVILLGHIDLSIPWQVTVGGMMSTAAAGWMDPSPAVPFGMVCGLAFGLFNGLGVAFLRIPPRCSSR